MKKFNLKNILCIFIIICPVLDMISFLYRNVFNTNFSPSTITRPIIPAIVIIYLFFKRDKKFKWNCFWIGLVYVIYGIVHIYLFNTVKTNMSYSNELHELQYLINYTFMILNLFLYIEIFKETDKERLKKSVLIANGIYIISIYLTIITKTSSSTYIEGMGYKGWFESGNSLSAILLLSMFIYLPYIKDKKYQKIVLPLLVLVGIFLCFLIGTRAGLFGFILVIALYVAIEIIYNLIKNKKVNKKLLIGGISGVAIIVILVVGIGSNTLQRRKHLKEIEGNIVDETKQENSHITGSLLEIKEKIESGNIEENYMSEAQKQSIIDLYNIANKLKVKNNDQRTQQLIYNLVLIKNQKNPVLILFGNGYMANYRELVFEMEFIALLLNFGLIGFILYLGPFLAIFVFAIYRCVKNRKEIDSKYVFSIFGLALAFALSLFSGYTFFNSSTMMIIIVLSTLLMDNKVLDKKL